MNLIQKAEQKAIYFFEHDATGHDWQHTKRVTDTAVFLAETEGADTELCRIAALLHDVADDKFHDQDGDGLNYVQRWLKENDCPEKMQKDILSIINTVSFKGGHNKTPESLEAEIVQDADRLDAIGAIGTARCFMFAGAFNEAMHDPDILPKTYGSSKAYREEKSTAVNHFYEKLLTIKETLHTPAARTIGEERHMFMKRFLETFLGEWEGTAFNKENSTPKG
ncbi:HD domain-containing protein [Alkalicoccus urumqiensis]|uniref:Phosphohydrolase n=1 Tax=Alkalicoccus urumqiensis TaxID=1548213 RepID=A0A2P6MDX6_ALKUR|nr:HD domain-containing protein [Alkalicoccus urumqiensis]PRO64470.1 phosphohydrolase [Alkalicoccus urumqiensis]